MKHFFTVVLVCAPYWLFAQTVLTVNISGFRSDNGHVLIKIIDEDKEIVASNITTISEGFSSTKFEIPAGTYALSYFHDENDNDELDTNFIGMPKEGFGFSNNAKGSFGPPKLKDQLFTVDEEVTMSLQVMYL